MTLGIQASEYRLFHNKMKNKAPLMHQRVYQQNFQPPRGPGIEDGKPVCPLFLVFRGHRVNIKINTPPPHRELVHFVELYCSRILNSFELMEIPLFHIELPIPYNRLFPMPEFIKPIVPHHRLLAGECVKKRWGTARSKERNIWPDDICFLQFIDSLAMCE